MEFKRKNRLINVEIQPIIMAALILGWAVYYYFSTINTPHGGADSVLFIKPLTFILLICFIFVLVGAVKIRSVKNTEVTTPGEVSKKDRGFLDHRRLFFVISLVAYCAGLTFLGYFIPSILFIFIVCYYLGVRNYWILIGLPIGLCTILSVVFRVLIKVPIPIWPSW